MELTRIELFEKARLEEVFSIENEIDRVHEVELLKLRAKALDCEKEFGNIIKVYEKQLKKYEAEEQRNSNLQHADFITSKLKTNQYGKPEATTTNYLTVMHGDEYFSGMKYNELTYAPEVERNGKTRRWSDVDDAAAREYIERKYHFHSLQKYEDATRIIFDENRYHPIQRAIESIEWDGTPRIRDFLSMWMGCEHTDYVCEVSRLIFAGGIHRIYSPGCKFDDVPVLIGTKQGEGKSTLTRWLAMRDEWYAEVTEIEGQKGMEAVEGAWICELGELVAVTRVKEVEAVKSFISRQVDHYRKPFDRRVSDYCRQCIFIGTTNKEQFLTDKTGNRRFYPVKVNQTGYDLFDNENAIKADIAQCWAEAKALYDANKLPPYADRKLVADIRAEQSKAVEDDYRVGMIEAYLEDKNETCVLDIWENALDERYSKPTKKDSNEIGLIMQGLEGWEKSAKTKRFQKYGVVKYWFREEDVPSEWTQVL